MPAIQQDKDFAEMLQDHHARMRDKIQQSIDRLKAAKTMDNREWINRQIQYFHWMLAGQKWSTLIATRKANKK
jgi:ATP-dependent protease ClpP protease subunit